MLRLDMNRSTLKWCVACISASEGHMQQLCLNIQHDGSALNVSSIYVWQINTPHVVYNLVLNVNQTGKIQPDAGK